MSVEVNPAPQYWLISNEDVRKLIASLEGEALHTLESGLHVTDALPADESRAQTVSALVERVVELEKLVEISESNSVQDAERYSAQVLDAIYSPQGVVPDSCYRTYRNALVRQKAQPDEA